MDAPKNNNPSRLVVLLSGLVVVLAGLFIIYFLNQTKIQIESADTNNVSEKSKITDEYYFEPNYKAPTTTYLPIRHRISNYYDLPQIIHLQFDKIANDISTYLDIDLKKLKYNGHDLDCTNSIYKYDSEIKFGSVKSQNEYLKFKNALLTELKVNDSPENMTILIKMLCKDDDSQYIQFSIEKYFNKDIWGFVKKANAAGGRYPESDDYLAILDLHYEKDPIIMSINPYIDEDSSPQNIVYSINQPEISAQIQFSNKELQGVLDESTLKYRDPSNRWVSFRNMDIYPPFEDNIFFSASGGGDGCGGDYSLFTLNVKTGKMRELFACITGCPGYNVICKNAEDEVYYRGPSYP